jgi:hypothetical protein
VISFVPFVPETFICTANGAVPEVGEAYIVAIGGVSFTGGGIIGGVISGSLWQLVNINGTTKLPTSKAFRNEFFTIPTRSCLLIVY